MTRPRTKVLKEQHLRRDGMLLPRVKKSAFLKIGERCAWCPSIRLIKMFSRLKVKRYALHKGDWAKVLTKAEARESYQSAKRDGAVKVIASCR